MDKIKEISVLFNVDYRGRDLEEADFDPRKYLPKQKKKWFGAKSFEDKRWSSFGIEGLLTVDELKAWLNEMPMHLLKTPSKDIEGVKWMIFAGGSSEAILRMYAHPFLESGNDSFSAKREAMLKEFGS